MNNIIKFLPIGGQAELGKNMTIFTINDEKFIIDAGYRIPESEKLGVDTIIPSFEYIIERQDEFKGIFISHGHNDCMAAISYLLKEVDLPIYTSSLTADLIEEIVGHYNRKSNNNIKPRINRIHRNDSIKVGSVNIKVFPLTHSIPGAIGFAFETPYGYLVHLGEYMIDFGAPDYFRTDVQSLMEIGNKGVLALFAESTYAIKTGYTAPYHKIYDLLKPIFEEASGRIIIASYAQNIFRMKEIIEICRHYNRKLVIYDRNKYDTTNILLRSLNKGKYQEILNSDNVIVDNDAIGKDHQLVILLTADPTRLYRDINNIIQGEDEILAFDPSDTFVMTCASVPGTEKIAAKVIDELYKTEAKIINFKNNNILSMHASQEDLKVALQIFKPKYYFPIRGEFQHFIANEEIALEMGIPPENIIVADNGEEITFRDGELIPNRTLYEIEDVMIDGIGIGDVGDKVIDDRIQLSKDGVVVIGITVNDDREIVTYTDVQTRGFVYLKDSEHVVKEIIRLSEETIHEFRHDYSVDNNDIRLYIRDRVSRYIFKATGKKPVVLPVIIELN